MRRKRVLERRAEHEIREAQENYLRAKQERDTARERRDWMLWEHASRLKRKTASQITGLSLGGVQAAIKRGEKIGLGLPEDRPQ